jgi:hypothetical protein
MSEKEIKIKAIKDFCRFIENFDGELIIKGTEAFFNGNVVYKLNF